MNGGAPRAFAEALLETGGRLMQVSTDFVFNGQQGSPYRPEQSRDPLGAYGRTKAAGEEAVEQVLSDTSAAMAKTLTLKNLPDDLHARLAAAASTTRKPRLPKL